ncbi:hypothetical protein [Glycomyces sp. NPDC047010]|uniref:hypothetical protein n=1 Tax=Glycomyces sp. NPDC047010 TaxID=3155023 RepID=UPI0033D74897
MAPSRRIQPTTVRETEAPTPTRGSGWGLVSALGKSMSTEAWAKDPECAVSASTLRSRLTRSWDPAEAITEPARPVNTRYTVEGRTLPLSQHVRDPRVTVSPKTVQRRLREGEPIASALFRPAKGAYARTDTYTPSPMHSHIAPR